MATPIAIHHCGREMTQLGRGAYPYDCVAKYKQPQAMVYLCKPCGAWTHEGHDTGSIVAWLEEEELDGLMEFQHVEEDLRP